jgi:L-fucose isomerase-like protein
MKIGFVNICHPDYDCGSAKSVADEAVQSLRNRGIKVKYMETAVLDVFGGIDAGRDMVRSEVDGVVVMLGTWIECPVAMAVIREIEHLPFCIYGYPVFNHKGQSFSNGSYVSLVMFKGSLDRAGYRYRYFLGSPGDTAVTDGMVSFSRAASALKSLRRTRIGLVGYSSMGIYPGTFDHLLMRTKIGPDIEHIDSYTVIRMAEATEDAACEPVIREYARAAEIMNDVTRADLVKCAKLYLALKQLVDEKKLSAITVKCQYEFSKEYKMVMCVPLSLLAETGTVTSCEGDMLNTVSMVILHFLSGQIVTYGDLLNNDRNVIRLSSCGFAPYSLGMEGTCKIRKFMPHPSFNGIQNSFVLKPGTVTVMRLVEDVGSYHIIYTVGKGLDSKLRDGYMPNLDVEIGGDVNRFIRNCAGQHFAVCYGDASDDIEGLASMLHIEAARL